MDEYIKREDVLKHKRKMSGADFGGEFWDEAVLCEDIIRIPAADMVEIRHGKWINKGDYAVCTECGERSGMQYDGVEPIPLMTQFCPNCGAKMDGGAD